jgi:peptidoglycan/LPS O-acetylase OafA/YrhL
MATYQVNRGVGKPIEFFGLRSQYVVYLVFLILLTLTISFILTTLLDALIALLIGIVSFLLAICSCFKLNNTFGEHGLMQLMASKKVVRHISVTRRIYQIVEDRDEKNK